MSPAQSAMILRKLEEMEDGQDLTCKQLNTIRGHVKGIEGDSDVILRRLAALGEENAKILKELDHQSRMIEQLIRRVSK